MNEAYSSNSYNLLLPTGEINQVLSVFTLPVKQDSPIDTPLEEPVEVQATDATPNLTPMTPGVTQAQQQPQMVNLTPPAASITPSPSGGSGGY